jgi:hypothetical protein
MASEADIALEGTYGELMAELFSQPRVYHRA